MSFCKLRNLRVRLSLFYLLWFGWQVNLAQSVNREKTLDALTLHVPPMTVKIDPSAGGRIISLKYDTVEFLTTKKQESQYFGATMWLAPESQWWKYNESLDKLVYRVKSSSANQIVILSEKLSDLQFKKTFRLIENDSSLHVIQSVTNVGLDDKRLSIWDLARTPGCDVFFPGKHPDTKSNLHNVSILDTGVLFQFDSNANRDHEKLFASVNSGWLACKKNNFIVLKYFQTSSDSLISKEHRTVEIFLNKTASYLELETHGPEVVLKPGDTREYSVVWKIIQNSKNQFSWSSNWASMVHGFAARNPYK